MEFINVNGKTLPSSRAFIKPNNHSYRYGDGLFETMKVIKGKISLARLHFDRLYKGLVLLKFEIPVSFTWHKLQEEIADLCRRNNCENLARLRLSVSRGHGTLNDVDENLHYLIECWPLDEVVTQFNQYGLAIDAFPDARKSCDAFSNLKSVSHLPYVMAVRFCKDKNLNDCLVLNNHGRVCDTSIANVFWISDEEISTPPLSEGCIAGVMRRYLMESLQSSQFSVSERNCEIHDLENADEVFLTNAIRGIKWVRQFRNKTYAKAVTEKVHQHLNQLENQ